MPNLIQVQNDLKQLSDEELQQATQQPSEQTPPFMLLAENNRRQGMRDDYEGEQARLQENRTTVMEDVTGAPPIEPSLPGMPPGPPPGPMPLGDIPPEAMAPGPPPGGLQAFANGGMVGAPGAQAAQGTYPGFESSLYALMKQQETDRSNAKSMALMNAGLMVMGGKSPYMAQNLALAAPAIGQYQQGLRQGNQGQLALMQAGAGFEASKRAEALSQMNFDFRKQQEARQARQGEARLDISRAAAKKPTAGIKDYEYFSKLSPTEQENFLSLKSAGREKTDTETRNYAAKTYNSILEKTQKIVGKDVMLMTKSPEEKQQIAEGMARKQFADSLPHLLPFVPWGDQPLSPPPPGGSSGVSIIDKLPEGATVKPLYDSLVYGSP